MALHSNESSLSKDGKNQSAAAAVVGMGFVAVALFPNPVTTPDVIDKCGYHIGRILGGQR